VHQVGSDGGVKGAQGQEFPIRRQGRRIPTRPRRTSEAVERNLSPGSPSRHSGAAGDSGGAGGVFMDGLYHPQSSERGNGVSDLQQLDVDALALAQGGQQPVETIVRPSDACPVPTSK